MMCAKAASVLAHRLPHPAKPHSRILPQRGISMKTRTNENRFEIIGRVFAGIMGIVYGASLIPLLVNSFYLHPAADDYSASFMTHQALAGGGGIAALFAAACREAARAYRTWQGTFAATFLFSLQPGIFGCYWITTWLMLGMLTCSTWFFLKTVLVRRLGVRKSWCALLTFLILLTEVQQVPNIAEAYFWYNGSSYYTLFYCVSLLFWAMIIHLLPAEKGQKKGLWAGCMFLAAILGGGNFTTALLTLEIAVLLFFCAIFRGKKLMIKRLIPILIILSAAMGVSMTAPGNQVRAAYMTGMSAPVAIGASFRNAALFCGQWTGWRQAAVILCALPVLSDASFRYLKTERGETMGRRTIGFFLRSGIAFGLFASQMTPPLYAMSNAGAGRQIDIYYYAYYLLILYLTWEVLLLLHGGRQEREKGENPAYGAGIIFYLLICAGIWMMEAVHGGIGSTTSGVAMKAYLSGEVQQYKRQFDAVDAALEQAEKTGETEVVLPSLPAVPGCFEYFDISRDDPGYWSNMAIARYYGLKAVTFQH